MTQVISKKSWMRPIALIVAALFIWETGAWATPAPLNEVLSPVAGGSREISFTQISIPAHMGSVQEIFQASDPRSSFLIHIEDAHGEPEAQKNSQAILEHLKKEYGVQAFFLEGAWSKLDPSLLSFSTNAEENQSILSELTEKGIVGGPENFLYENSQPGAQGPGARARKGASPASGLRAPAVFGYGIEDLDLYKKNLEQFRATISAKAASDVFLNEMKAGLLTKASQVLNPELAEYFRQWSFQEEVQTDYVSHLRALAEQAQKHLGLDLNDAREQYDWPMLVRYQKLKAFDDGQTGDLRPELGAESKRLTNWLEEKSLSIYRDLLFSGLGPPVSALREGFERFYEKAALLGFKFKDYPVLSKTWGQQMLAQELDAPSLIQEIKRLEDKLIERLAQKPDEKKFITKYREYLLIKKLLNLELSRDEWREISPEAGGRRLENAESVVGARVSGLGAEIESTIQKARDFYSTAEARDSAMVKRTVDWIKKEKIEKAAIITGGFHSEGLSALLKQKNISYVRIQPRITQIHGRENYLKWTLGEKSFLRAVSPAEPDAPAVFRNALAAEVAAIVPEIAVTSSRRSESRFENTAQPGVVKSGGIILDMYQNPAAAAENVRLSQILQHVIEEVMLWGQIEKKKGNRVLYRDLVSRFFHIMRGELSYQERILDEADKRKIAAFLTEHFSDLSLLNGFIGDQARQRLLILAARKIFENRHVREKEILKNKAQQNPAAGMERRSFLKLLGLAIPGFSMAGAAAAAPAILSNSAIVDLMGANMIARNANTFIARTKIVAWMDISDRTGQPHRAMMQLIEKTGMFDRIIGWLRWNPQYMGYFVGSDYLSQIGRDDLIPQGDDRQSFVFLPKIDGMVRELADVLWSLPQSTIEYLAKQYRDPITKQREKISFQDEESKGFAKDIAALKKKIAALEEINHRNQFQIETALRHVTEDSHYGFSNWEKATKEFPILKTWDELNKLKQALSGLETLQYYSTIEDQEVSFDSLPGIRAKAGDFSRISAGANNIQVTAYRQWQANQEIRMHPATLRSEARRVLVGRSGFEMIHSDEISITKHGLEEIFKADRGKLAKAIQQELDQFAGGKNEVVFKGVLFFRRQSGSSAVWAFKDGESGKIREIFKIILAPDPQKEIGVSLKGLQEMLGSKNWSKRVFELNAWLDERAGGANEQTIEHNGQKIRFFRRIGMNIAPWHLERKDLENFKKMFVLFGEIQTGEITIAGQAFQREFRTADKDAKVILAELDKAEHEQQLSVKWRGITFHRRYSGHLPVWVVLPEDRAAFVREFKIDDRGNIDDIQAGEYALSDNGIRAAFDTVPSDKEMYRAVIDALEKKSNKTKPTAREIEYHGIIFKKRFSRVHQVWAFAEADKEKVRKLIGLYKEIEPDEIAVSLPGLTPYTAAPMVLLDWLKDQLPDLDSHPDEDITMEGIAFSKRRNGPASTWTFKGSELYKVLGAKNRLIGKAVTRPVNPKAVAVQNPQLADEKLIYLRGTPLRQALGHDSFDLDAMIKELDRLRGDDKTEVELSGVRYHWLNHGQSTYWAFAAADLDQFAEARNFPTRIKPDETSITRNNGNMKKMEEVIAALDKAAQGKAKLEHKGIVYRRRISGTNAVWTYPSIQKQAFQKEWNWVDFSVLPVLTAADAVITGPALKLLYPGDRSRENKRIGAELDAAADGRDAFEYKGILITQKRSGKEYFWTFPLKDKDKFAQVFKVALQIQPDEIPMIGGKLQDYFLGRRLEVAQHLNAELNKLDPQGELMEVEYKGIRFYKRLSAKTTGWVAKKHDMLRIMALYPQKRPPRRPVQIDPKKILADKVETVMAGLVGQDLHSLALRYGREFEEMVWQIVGPENLADRDMLREVFDEFLIAQLNQAAPVGSTAIPMMSGAVPADDAKQAKDLPVSEAPRRMDATLSADEINDLAGRFESALGGASAQAAVQSLARQQAVNVIKALEEQYFFKKYYRDHEGDYQGDLARQEIEKILRKEKNALTRDALKAFLEEVKAAVKFDAELHRKGLKANSHLDLYQGIASLRMLRERNMILADQMGVGKTMQAIATFLASGEKEMAVFGPKMILSRWVEDLVVHTDVPLEIVAIVGKDKVREFQEILAAIPGAESRIKLKIFDNGDGYDYLLNARAAPPTGTKRVLLMNYQRLPNLLQRKQASGSAAAIEVPFLVLDEFQLLKRSGTQSAEAIFGNGNGVLGVNAKWKLLLSGTPLENQISDLFAGLNFLAAQEDGAEAEWLRKMRRQDFTQFFSTQELGRLAQLHGYLKRKMIRRLKEDVLSGLPEKIYRKVVLNPWSGVMTEEGKGGKASETKLPGSYAAQRELYESYLLYPSETEAALRALRRNENGAEDDEEAAESTAAKTTQIMRMEQATLDPLQLGVSADSIKFDAASQLLNARVREEQKSCLVVTNFRGSAKAFHEYLLSQGYNGNEVGFIAGGVDADERRTIMQAFQSGKIKILVATTAAVELGIELTRADAILFLNHPWKPSTREQVIDRTHRRDPARNYPGRKLEIISLEVDLPVSIDRLKLQVLRRKEILSQMVIDGQLAPEILKAFKTLDDVVMRSIEQAANPVLLDEYEKTIQQQFLQMLGQALAAADPAVQAAIWDEMAALYLEILEHKGSFFANMASLEFLSERFPDLARGGIVRALDLASGPSTLKRAYERNRPGLAGKNFSVEVTDYDLSRNMLALGKRGGLQIQGALDDLEKAVGEANLLKPESFELVNLSYGMSYVRHPAKLVEQVNRLLVPQGLFVLILPPQTQIPGAFFTGLEKAGFEIQTRPDEGLQSRLADVEFADLVREYGAEFAQDAAREVKTKVRYIVARKKGAATLPVQDSDFKLERQKKYPIDSGKIKKLVPESGGNAFLPAEMMVDGHLVDLGKVPGGVESEDARALSKIRIALARVQNIQAPDQVVAALDKMNLEFDAQERFFTAESQTVAVQWLERLWQNTRHREGILGPSYGTSIQDRIKKLSARSEARTDENKEEAYFRRDNFELIRKGDMARLVKAAEQSNRIKIRLVGVKGRPLFDDLEYLLLDPANAEELSAGPIKRKWRTAYLQNEDTGEIFPTSFSMLESGNWTYRDFSRSESRSTDAGQPSTHVVTNKDEEVVIRVPRKTLVAYDVFNPKSDVLAKAIRTIDSGAENLKLYVVVDSGLGEENIAKIRAYFSAQKFSEVTIQIVEGGEPAKDHARGEAVVREIMQGTKDAGMGRKEVIFGIGGGAVIDVVRYAASRIHRGTYLAVMGTTGVTAFDAIIGVKGGINQFGEKNYEGTFYVPHLVVVDPGMLRTLSEINVLGGLAEAIKVSLVRDKGLFELIEKGHHEVRNKNFVPHGIAEEILVRSLQLHSDQISTDPLEMKKGRPLDFGHWAAHKLESITKYKVSHGEAVAIGMAVDTHISWQRGLIDETTRDRIINLIRATGLPTYHSFAASVDEEVEQLLPGLKSFRDHLGRGLVSLISGIGQEHVIGDQDMITNSEFNKAWTFLSKGARSEMRGQLPDLNLLAKQLPEILNQTFKNQAGIGLTTIYWVKPDDEGKFYTNAVYGDKNEIEKNQAFFEKLLTALVLEFVRGKLPDNPGVDAASIDIARQWIQGAQNAPVPFSWFIEQDPLKDFDEIDLRRLTAAFSLLRLVRYVMEGKIDYSRIIFSKRAAEAVEGHMMRRSEARSFVPQAVPEWFRHLMQKTPQTREKVRFVIHEEHSIQHTAHARPSVRKDDQGVEWLKLETYSREWPLAWIDWKATEELTLASTQVQGKNYLLPFSHRSEARTAYEQYGELFLERFVDSMEDLAIAPSRQMQLRAKVKNGLRDPFISALFKSDHPMYLYKENLFWKEFRPINEDPLDYSLNSLTQVLGKYIDIWFAKKIRRQMAVKLQLASVHNGIRNVRQGILRLGSYLPPSMNGKDSKLYRSAEILGRVTANKLNKYDYGSLLEATEIFREAVSEADAAGVDNEPFESGAADVLRTLKSFRHFIETAEAFAKKHKLPFSHRSEMRLIEKGFNLAGSVPEEFYDFPIEIVLIADNTGTLTDHLDKAQTKEIRDGLSQILNDSENILIVNSGDPGELVVKSNAELIDRLKKKSALNRWFITADGGTMEGSLDSQGRLQVDKKMSDWPEEVRYQFSVALTNYFYDEILKRLSSGEDFKKMPDINGQEIELDRARALREMETKFKEGKWAIKADGEKKNVGTYLLPQYLGKDAFVYDSGAKLAVDTVGASKYISWLELEFFEALEARFKAEVLPSLDSQIERVDVFAGTNFIDLSSQSKVEGVENILKTKVPSAPQNRIRVYVKIGDGVNDLPTLNKTFSTRRNEADLSVFLAPAEERVAHRLGENVFVSNQAKTGGAEEVIIWLTQISGKTINQLKREGKSSLLLQVWEKGRSEMRLGKAEVESRFKEVFKDFLPKDANVVFDETDKGVITVLVDIPYKKELFKSFAQTAMVGIRKKFEQIGHELIQKYSDLVYRFESKSHVVDAGGFIRGTFIIQPYVTQYSQTPLNPAELRQQFNLSTLTTNLAKATLAVKTDISEFAMPRALLGKLNGLSAERRSSVRLGIEQGKEVKVGYLYRLPIEELIQQIYWNEGRGMSEEYLKKHMQSWLEQNGLKWFLNEEAYAKLKASFFATLDEYGLEVRIDKKYLRVSAKDAELLTKGIQALNIFGLFQPQLDDFDRDDLHVAGTVLLKDPIGLFEFWVSQQTGESPPSLVLMRNPDEWRYVYGHFSRLPAIQYQNRKYHVRENNFGWGESVYFSVEPAPGEKTSKADVPIKFDVRKFNETRKHFVVQIEPQEKPIPQKQQTATSAVIREAMRQLGYTVEIFAPTQRSEARSAPKFKNLVGNGKGLGYLPFLRIWSFLYQSFKAWTVFRKKPWPIQIEGFENLQTQDSFILAGNHTNYVDAPLMVTELYNLAGRMPLFIAKPKHLDIWTKWLIRLGAALPAEGNTLEKAEQFLRENPGAILGLFPSGKPELAHKELRRHSNASMSNDEFARDFLNWDKSAVAKIAMETGVSIIPFSIDSNIPHKWGLKELWHAFRQWQKSGANQPPFYIKVRIGKPISPKGKSEAEVLENLKNSVVANLKVLATNPRENPQPLFEDYLHWFSALLAKQPDLAKWSDHDILDFFHANMPAGLKGFPGWSGNLLRIMTPENEWMKTLSADQAKLLAMYVNYLKFEYGEGSIADHPFTMPRREFVQMLTGLFGAMTTAGLEGLPGVVVRKVSGLSQKVLDDLPSLVKSLGAERSALISLGHSTVFKWATAHLGLDAAFRNWGVKNKGLLAELWNYAGERVLHHPDGTVEQPLSEQESFRQNVLFNSWLKDILLGKTEQSLPEDLRGKADLVKDIYASAGSLLGLFNRGVDIFNKLSPQAKRGITLYLGKQKKTGGSLNDERYFESEIERIAERRKSAEEKLWRAWFERNPRFQTAAQHVETVANPDPALVQYLDTEWRKARKTIDQQLGGELRDLEDQQKSTRVARKIIQQVQPYMLSFQQRTLFVGRSEMRTRAEAQAQLTQQIDQAAEIALNQAKQAIAQSRRVSEDNLLEWFERALHNNAKSEFALAVRRIIVLSEEAKSKPTIGNPTKKTLLFEAAANKWRLETENESVLVVQNGFEMSRRTFGITLLGALAAAFCGTAAEVTRSSAAMRYFAMPDEWRRFLLGPMVKDRVMDTVFTRLFPWFSDMKINDANGEKAVLEREGLVSADATIRLSQHLWSIDTDKRDPWSLAIKILDRLFFSQREIRAWLEEFIITIAHTAIHTYQRAPYAHFRSDQEGILMPSTTPRDGNPYFPLEPFLGNSWSQDRLENSWFVRFLGTDLGWQIQHSLSQAWRQRYFFERLIGFFNYLSRLGSAELHRLYDFVSNAEFLGNEPLHEKVKNIRKRYEQKRMELERIESSIELKIMRAIEWKSNDDLEYAKNRLEFDELKIPQVKREFDENLRFSEKIEDVFNGFAGMVFELIPPHSQNSEGAHLKTAQSVASSGQVSLRSEVRSANNAMHIVTRDTVFKLGDRILDDLGGQRTLYEVLEAPDGQVRPDAATKHLYDLAATDPVTAAAMGKHAFPQKADNVRVAKLDLNEQQILGSETELSFASILGLEYFPRSEMRDGLTRRAWLTMAAGFIGAATFVKAQAPVSAVRAQLFKPAEVDAETLELKKFIGSEIDALLSEWALSQDKEQQKRAEFIKSILPTTRKSLWFYSPKNSGMIATSGAVRLRFGNNRLHEIDPETGKPAFELLFSYDFAKAIQELILNGNADAKDFARNALLGGIFMKEMMTLKPMIEHPEYFEILAAAQMRFNNPVSAKLKEDGKIEMAPEKLSKEERDFLITTIAYFDLLLEAEGYVGELDYLSAAYPPEKFIGTQKKMMQLLQDPKKAEGAWSSHFREKGAEAIFGFLRSRTHRFVEDKKFIEKWNAASHSQKIKWEAFRHILAVQQGKGASMGVTVSQWLVYDAFMRRQMDVAWDKKMDFLGSTPAELGLPESVGDLNHKIDQFRARSEMRMPRAGRDSLAAVRFFYREILRLHLNMMRASYRPAEEDEQKQAVYDAVAVDLKELQKLLQGHPRIRWQVAPRIKSAISMLAERGTKRNPVAAGTALTQAVEDILNKLYEPRIKKQGRRHRDSLASRKIVHLKNRTWILKQGVYRNVKVGKRGSVAMTQKQDKQFSSLWELARSLDHQLEKMTSELKQARETRAVLQDIHDFIEHSAGELPPDLSARLQKSLKKMQGQWVIEKQLASQALQFAIEMEHQEIRARVARFVEYASWLIKMRLDELEGMVASVQRLREKDLKNEVMSRNYNFARSLRSLKVSLERYFGTTGVTWRSAREPRSVQAKMAGIIRDLEQVREPDYEGILALMRGIQSGFGQSLKAANPETESRLLRYVDVTLGLVEFSSVRHNALFEFEKRKREIGSRSEEMDEDALFQTVFQDLINQRKLNDRTQWPSAWFDLYAFAREPLHLTVKKERVVNPRFEALRVVAAILGAKTLLEAINRKKVRSVKGLTEKIKELSGGDLSQSIFSLPGDSRKQLFEFIEVAFQIEKKLPLLPAQYRVRSEMRSEPISFMFVTHEKRSDFEAIRERILAAADDFKKAGQSFVVFMENGGPSFYMFYDALRTHLNFDPEVDVWAMERFLEDPANIKAAKAWFDTFISLDKKEKLTNQAKIQRQLDLEKDPASFSKAAYEFFAEQEMDVVNEVPTAQAFIDFMRADNAMRLASIYVLQNDLTKADEYTEKFIEYLYRSMRERNNHIAAQIRKLKVRNVIPILGLVHYSLAADLKKEGYKAQDNIENPESIYASNEPWVELVVRRLLKEYISPELKRELIRKQNLLFQLTLAGKEDSELTSSQRVLDPKRSETREPQEFVVDKTMRLDKRFDVEKEIREALEIQLEHEHDGVDTPSWWPDWGGKYYLWRVLQGVIGEIAGNLQHLDESEEMVFRIFEKAEDGVNYIVLESQNNKSEISDIPWAVKRGNTTARTRGLGLPFIIDFTIFSFGGQVQIESRGKGYRFASDKLERETDLATIGKEISSSLERGTRISLFIPVLRRELPDSSLKNVRSEARVNNPQLVANKARTAVAEANQNIFAVEFVAAMSRSEFRSFYDRFFPEMAVLRQKNVREIALRKAGLALQVDEGLIVGADLAGTEGFWEAAKILFNGQKIAILGEGKSPLENVRFVQDISSAKQWVNAKKIVAWVSPDEALEHAELRKEVFDWVIMNEQRLAKLYSALGLEAFAQKLMISREFLRAA